MKTSIRLLLVPALLVALLASGCSGLPAGDSRSTGASRSGVEVFGTIDAGVSRTDTKR
jgi:NCAIR mutase (PurE)-related protein